MSARRSVRAGLLVGLAVLSLFASALLPPSGVAAGHSELASFDARLGGGLAMDVFTGAAGMPVQTGVPLYFNSHGSQAASYPGGFRTLTQPFEDGLFGSIVIVGVAHNSAPVGARFKAVVRNATTDETIVEVSDIRVDNLQLESDQFSPNPEDHCSALSETGGTAFQITLAPTVNEVLVAPTDNLQLELVPTQVFGGQMELCVDHPHHTALSLVVERITPPNQAPSPAADSASTPKNVPVAIDVLANDSDADGDALSVAAVSSPASGSALVDAAGRIVYTPAAGFVGSDSFTYTASDGISESPPATVEVTVFNRRPVAVDDSVTTYKNTAVSISVLSNDSDPDGDAVSVSAVGTPGAGAAAANPDDTVTYTPSPGVSGVDTFAYRVTDGTDESDPGTVTVDVVNRPPDCAAATPSIATIWSPDHRFIPVHVQGVTDPDGDSVTTAVDSIRQDEPTDTTGDGSFAPDGRINGSTADVRAERAGAGDGRVYHVAFTADDGDGGTCSGVVRVTVPHDARRLVAGDGGPLHNSLV